MTTRATPSDLVAGIEPGSIPQGDRAGLEQGLAALGTGQGTGPNAAAVAGGAATPTGGDPIAALLSGDVDPGGPGLPITDGLSVGPGEGPAIEQLDPQMVRLQQIATQASSPLLRAAARNELRRIVGEAV